MEFLDEQMSLAEVLAVEIRQSTGQRLKTLVPRVIGMTAETEQRKLWPQRTSQWTYHTPRGHRPAVRRVQRSGAVELAFNDYRSCPPIDDIVMRRQLLERLNAIPDVSVPDERLDTWVNMPLLALADSGAFNPFLQTREW